MNTRREGHVLADVTPLDREVLRAEQARHKASAASHRYRHWAFVGLLPESTVALVGGLSFGACLERVWSMHQRGTRLVVAWAQDCRPVSAAEWTRLAASSPPHPSIVRRDFSLPVPEPMPVLEPLGDSRTSPKTTDSARPLPRWFTGSATV